jgi:N-acylneuraminate cytidylyltransferase
VASRKLALIPARGGSRRLLRKNVRPFGGRPMLAWTIDAARSADIFQRIVVSTDDEEIADIAQRNGAEVALRDARLSDDAATLFEVALNFVTQVDTQVDQLCILLPNCPLRTATDVLAGHATMTAYEAPAVISVCSYNWTPPFRAQVMRSDVTLEPVFPEWAEAKSQSYPEVLCLSGAVYWADPERLRAGSSLTLPGLRGVQIPWHRAIDIDTYDDFQLAACVRHALDTGFEFEG